MLTKLTTEKIECLAPFRPGRRGGGVKVESSSPYSRSNQSDTQGQRLHILQRIVDIQQQNNGGIDNSHSEL